MTTQDRNQSLWAEVNRHLEDAAIVFQQLPEGVYTAYLSYAIGAWQRVGKEPLTGEQLAEMVEVLFTVHREQDSRKEEP
jgi:hypothetical protein